MSNAADSPTQFVAAALLAAIAGCGDVMLDARPDAAPQADSAPPAINRCAPATCLLADEFDGPGVNTSLWGTAMAGGATVTQHDGILTLKLPAAADAYADVFSLVGFPVGSMFEARVTFTQGQFYDHKGFGFASSRIDSGCDAGESDAAMFRGQDDDGYVETKTGGGLGACVLNHMDYTASTRTLKVFREGTRVIFTDDGVQLGPLTGNIPTGLLPVRFSAYTYTRAPLKPVQIDIEWVAVSRPDP